MGFFGLRETSLRFGALIAWLLWIGGVSAQTVLRVDPDAPPGGDGSTWALAFNDLQDALDALPVVMLEPAEIWLTAGTCRPDKGTGNRNASFQLVDGLTIRGGFTGTETSPDDRVEPWPESILSGEIGDSQSTLDNSYHVVTLTEFFASAALEGVVITGGRADGGGDDGEGGGLRTRFAAIDVSRCTFRNNWAETGGGMYSENGTATVTATVFRDNFADLEGGGAFLRDDLLVSECSFINNVGGFGGGLTVCCIDLAFGSGAVEDCVFVDNFADFGGGMFVPNGTGRALRCRFQGNSASRGGGVYNSSDDAVFANCVFNRNVSDLGGGIYNSGDLELTNAQLVRNTAFTSGGGIYTLSPLTLANCTVYSNACLFSTSSGGVHSVDGPLAVRNTILWSNTNGDGASETAQVRIVSGGYAFEWSVIEAWTGQLVSQGCFSLSPQFVSPSGPDGMLGTEDDDFRLAMGSPCIDAGSNSLLSLDGADMDGDGDVNEAIPEDCCGIDRIVDDPLTAGSGAGLSDPVVDVGAREYVPPCLGDVDGDGMVSFDDLNMVLLAWGTNVTPGTGADVNGDGHVDFDDANIVFVMWADGCTVNP